MARDRATSPGAPRTGDELRDVPGPVTPLSHETVYHGRIWDVARDELDLGSGTACREYVVHTGAVGILAVDDRDRVLMVRQYRHPVRMRLWEIPAGLLDVPGESAVDAARRELYEEADLRAADWHVLVDWFNSPGGSSEAVRAFVARGLSGVPAAERFERTDEEAGMEYRWVTLDEARDAVLGGRVHNPTAVVAVLAACAARAEGWTTLRPADAPWPEYDAAPHP